MLPSDWKGSLAGSSAQDSVMTQGKRKWQDVDRSDLAEAGWGLQQLVGYP